MSRVPRPSVAGLAVAALLLGAALRCAAATMADGLDVYGYFEPELSAADVGGESMQMMANKLHIDLEAAVGDRASFKGDFVYVTYPGETVYHLVDYLPGSIASTLPPEARDAYVLELADRNELDNAFVKIAFTGFDLTVGRLQVSPGTGYAWNPTDLYNVKDILDPTYENPGHDAVQADVPLGSLGTAMFLYGPEEDFTRSSKFARVKVHAGGFDISVAAGERHVTLTDFTAGTTALERRRLAGGDFAGELLGLGVWGEAAWNDMKTGEDYFEGLLGVDYTFDGGTYLLNEFYLNGQGAADESGYGFDDWMRFLTAERKTVTRAQWYLYASHPATDLLSVGGSVITSLSDGSFVLVPTLEYSVADDLDLTLFGNIYVGAEGKAYSPKLGQGGLLRLRYYF